VTTAVQHSTRAGSSEFRRLVTSKCGWSGTAAFVMLPSIRVESRLLDGKLHNGPFDLFGAPAQRNVATGLAL
jgi:hypothetical protein